MALSIQAALISALPLVAVTSTALAQSTTDSAAPVQELETVQVTGSRIARSEVEGPAPITVITAKEISDAGFTTVPDVLRSLTQNGGETQSQQSGTGAVTTPGAQQVDLRGLGPNKTLVLINGRRVADFPLPLRGQSNFTDVGNIPLGMVDRILYLANGRFTIGTPDEVLRSEVLSGLYGTPVEVIRTGGRVFVVGIPDDGEHHLHLDGHSHDHFAEPAVAP
jgi:outer membrane cobalamin receptor